MLKISDFMTTREFRRTRVYQEVYRQTGAMHKIALTISPVRGTFIGIALSRDRLDFSEADRRTLQAVRPHLVRAHQNARVLSRGRRMLALLEQGLAIPVVALTRHNGVAFASATADRLLSSYFGARRSHRLPDRLHRWLASPRADGADGFPHAVPPFVLERDGRRLTVQLLRQADHRLLLLAEEVFAVPVRSLTARGLTPREADILRWVTTGKTNPEIAIILGLSPRTVQHTLERIYRKLGVETRTAATAWALQATADPE